MKPTNSIRMLPIILIGFLLATGILVYLAWQHSRMRHAVPGLNLTHLERVVNMRETSGDVLDRTSISINTVSKDRVEFEAMFARAATRASEVVSRESPVTALIGLVSGFDSSSIMEDSIVFKRAIATVPPAMLSQSGISELQAALLKSISSNDHIISAEAFGCLDYLRLRQLIPPSAVLECASPPYSSGISERVLAIAFTTSGPEYLKFTELVLDGGMPVTGNVGRVVRNVSMESIFEAHRTLRPKIIEKYKSGPIDE